MKTNKAIIVGASTGIGHALAREYSRRGHTLGLTARRFDLLEQLQQELVTPVHIIQMDVSKTHEAQELLRKLINDMNGVDLIILNAGVGIPNPKLLWNNEEQTIAVNVMGFAALANVAYHFFEEQGYGHLVGVSSIAAYRGFRHNPAYPASKAFMANYLEGLQHKAARRGLPITVTDVKPGYVDTPMVQHNKRMFWVATPEKAARQMADGIERHKHHLYITRRWRFAAWLFRLLPDFLYWKLV